MSDLTLYADRLETRRGDKKQWLRTEKRSLLQLPIALETARARLLNAFRSDVTDNKGWIFPLVKFHGEIAGDELTLTCTKYGRPPIHYNVTGRLLDDAAGGSQIVLQIVDDLRFRILMTPFCALFPVFFGAYFLGLRGWLFAGAVVLGGFVWAALGTVVVYMMAMRHRDTALGDVRRFLSQAVLQDPRMTASR